ncbi:MAG: T9SS type A sorting domain-containing protein [Candidatus Eisenbacteria bacterium]|nr:T9SS type A sorting domain-containing protein [Candidatus Eisenbacteria bacterium]
MNSQNIILLFAFVIIIHLRPAAATTLHVPDEYSTIQAAVVAASATGDVIEVSGGTYDEAVSIYGKQLDIVGVDGMQSTTVTRIIWGNPAEDPYCGGSLTGFNIAASLAAEQLKQEFRLRASQVQNSVLISAAGPYAGGDENSIHVESCHFLGDVTIDQYNYYEAATVDSCTFENASLHGGSELGFDVSSCTFHNGGIVVAGEVVSIEGNVVVGSVGIYIHIDSLGGVIAGNVVDGGGIEAVGWADLFVSDNVVKECIVGINTTDATYFPVVNNNDVSHCDTGITCSDESIVTNNLVWSCIDGIILDGWFVELRGNTVVDCSGDGVRWSSSSERITEISCNIIVGNGSGVTVTAGADIDLLSCNDVWNNLGGNWFGIINPTGVDGNISVDPLFCGPHLADYTLGAASPCLPGNHPDGAPCELIGKLGQGCDDPADVPEGDAEGMQSWIRLSKSTPNPTMGCVKYSVNLRDSGPVRINVYDVNGRIVDTLIQHWLSAGSHEFSWDPRSNNDRELNSGVYYLRMEAGRQRATRKIVLINN